MLKNGQKRVEREEKKVRRYAFQESNQFFTCLGGQKTPHKNSTEEEDEDIFSYFLAISPRVVQTNKSLFFCSIFLKRKKIRN